MDRRLRESGFEHGLAGFLRTLRRLSREYHDANVEEILSAREASHRYFFSNDENSSSEDLRNLYAIWDHCHHGLSDDMRHSMLGETALSDEDLQTNLPIEVALLALLSCSFDGGLEEMFKEMFMMSHNKQFTLTLRYTHLGLCSIISASSISSSRIYIQMHIGRKVTGSAVSNEHDTAAEFRLESHGVRQPA